MMSFLLRNGRHRYLHVRTHSIPTRRSSDLSDVSEGGNVQRLRELGIAIQVGHRAENIGEASVVVVSSAIKPDNPELTAARALMIPIVRRAEMLGELMQIGRA